jgi:hypothetical protein
MLASYTPLLTNVIDLINKSITAQDVAGVRITQVNVLMPDDKAVTLFWNDQAFTNDDGTFRGDWEITAT